MKKILLFLLLLVNLQLTTDNGSLSIELGEVAAQNMNNELSEVIVYGGNGWTHCGCGKYVARSAYSYHILEECPLREILCKKCGHSYRVSSVHNCSPSLSSTNTTESTCQYCHKTKSQCNCRCAFCGKKVGNCWCSVTITGKGGNIGYSVTGGSGVSGGSSSSNDTEYAGGLDNTGQSASNGKEPTYKRILMIDLFNLAKAGKVKLIPNLPNTLPKQQEEGECVVRALAFILYYYAQYRNLNYDQIYRALFEDAYWDDDCDLYGDGVPITPPYKLKTIFKGFCDIDIDNNNSVNNIISYINRGIPIATTKFSVDKKGKTHKHMVTVIGYDEDFFYVVSGKTEENANKIPRNNLHDTPLYLINK